MNILLFIGGNQPNKDEESKCTKDKNELRVANYKRLSLIFIFGDNWLKNIENIPIVKSQIWMPMVWNNFCIRVDKIDSISVVYV